MDEGTGDEEDAGSGAQTDERSGDNGGSSCQRGERAPDGVCIVDGEKSLSWCSGASSDESSDAGAMASLDGACGA